MRAILCAVVFAFVATAETRVGETWHEIHARYGGAVLGSKSADELGNDTWLFNFHDFTVLVTFVSGVSELEKFVKYKDHVPAEAWEKMTIEEVAAILGAYESTGVKWGRRVQTRSGQCGGPVPMGD